ncbi:phosphomannomutase/phosphoglucomutase [compost metagenome]
MLSDKRAVLSELVEDRMGKFPCSGEINYKVENIDKVLSDIEAVYGRDAEIDRTDGISIDLKDWRFNVRCSNTEALLRLNVEAKNDRGTVVKKLEGIENIIMGYHK